MAKSYRYGCLSLLASSFPIDTRKGFVKGFINRYSLLCEEDINTRIISGLGPEWSAGTMSESLLVAIVHCGGLGSYF